MIEFEAALVPEPSPSPPPVQLTDGLAFGVDYNPEQWDRATWDEDVRLMREACVNLVSLGIFAWGTVETADGIRDWSWMDEIVDLLHGTAIGIDLATTTAASISMRMTSSSSPRSWWSTTMPPNGCAPSLNEAAPSWSPTSPVFAARTER
ncbi:beta-galactosidase [Glycomyces sp. TRM65418]|uniref:beta-galactosidase n=1 Tax=Glycomyces sp. TRM65418 TaxID=2867006 RepID=UPI001D15FAE5|nr:beta-galactosidase [Glycomyces sp. TRM65418]MCC3764484.1 beta-galactosidase [Glycomyces sp. TRM65418]